jgi:cell division topological specificity factor
MLSKLLKSLFVKEPSKETAKKRLKLALVYDRLEVTDDLLKNLQNDMVQVISKYFVIDKNAIKLDIQRSDDFSALVLNTPIVSTRHQVRPV